MVFLGLPVLRAFLHASISDFYVCSPLLMQSLVRSEFVRSIIVYDLYEMTKKKGG